MNCYFICQKLSKCSKTHFSMTKKLHWPRLIWPTR